MTRRQSEVLEQIKKFIKRQKYPPTFAELGVLCGGVSKGSIQAAVKGLIKHEKVTMRPREARSLEVVNGSTE